MGPGAMDTGQVRLGFGPGFGLGFALVILCASLCAGLVEGSCGRPPSFRDQTFLGIKDTYQSGDRVLYRCIGDNAHMSQKKTAVSVCYGDSGTWSRPLLNCMPPSVPIICPALPQVTHGSVRLSSVNRTFGDTATFSCNVGYVYSEDFDVRQCQKDGTWSELDGNCEAIDCGIPYINNGTYRLDSGTGYRANAVFTCDEGTERYLSVEGTVSICNVRQLWDPAPPICYRRGDTATLSRCPSANLLPYTTSMVAHPYNNKCYQFVYVERYWPQARDYCKRYGGRLLTLPDASTNAFVLRILNALPWKNRGVWIGLHDRANEMVWDWTTETAGGRERLTWTNWGRGHPRASFHHFRDCVRMVRGGNWRWHETPCATLNWKYRSICQYEMQPTTSAHVATSPVTTREPPLTRRLPPTPVPAQRSTSTFRYGVGSEGGRSPVNGGDSLRETGGTGANGGTGGTGQAGLSRTAPPSPEVTTEERVDIVIPLSLQQNNDGNTNMLGGVVISCLIMVLLSLLVIIVVYFRRRRQKKALASSINMSVTNPTYCSATRGSVVTENGQTTLLKMQQTRGNEYTDEPLRGHSFGPHYKDDVMAEAEGGDFEEEYHQEVKVIADDNFTFGGKMNNLNSLMADDQNRDNYTMEKSMENAALSHVYSDPYDVPSQNLFGVGLPQKAGVKLRPKMPAPGETRYMAINGTSSGCGPTSTCAPRVVSDAYLIPVSSNMNMNIYAEISGDDHFGDDDHPLAGNLYESLDDIGKSSQHRNTSGP